MGIALCRLMSFKHFKKIIVTFSVGLLVAHAGVNANANPKATEGTSHVNYTAKQKAKWQRAASRRAVDRRAMLASDRVERFAGSSTMKAKLKTSTRSADLTLNRDEGETHWSYSESIERTKGSGNGPNSPQYGYAERTYARSADTADGYASRKLKISHTSVRGEPRTRTRELTINVPKSRYKYTFKTLTDGSKELTVREPELYGQESFFTIKVKPDGSYGGVAKAFRSRHKLRGELRGELAKALAAKSLAPYHTIIQGVLDGPPAVLTENSPEAIRDEQAAQAYANTHFVLDPDAAAAAMAAGY